VSPAALSRAARLAAVGAALFLLLAVVAIASRGGFGHDGTSASSAGYSSWAVSAFLVVFFAAAPFALYVLVLQQREALVRRRRKGFARRVLETLLVLATITAVLALRTKLHAYLFSRPSGHPGVPAHARSAAQGARRVAGGPHFEYAVLWIALGLAVVLLLALFALRRRAAATEQASVGDELAATIGDAIDDLEREPDARRAVIAAYARMEGVLARNGLRRLASETPLEYLARALTGLTSRHDAVARLTRLFEVAKFSRRDVDDAMKGEAIGALREIRDGLAASA
jgi:Domain of unknown function (DUF4129)